MTPTSPSGSGVSGSIAGSVLPLRRAEELIATLPGVLSVRIVPSDTGAIDEIHVLTTDAVLPKSTVRNIESALMAELGLRVNHRKVSVATTLDASRAVDRDFATASESVVGNSFSRSEPVSSLVTERSSSASMTGDGRRVLIFEDVEVRRSRSKGVMCRVTLSRDSEHYFGESEGAESERSRIELAARAALGAIVHASGRGERVLSYEGSKLIDAFDREFIFVSITARMGRDLVVLTGSCEIRESAETSAVLAVLDATNRWLHLAG